LADGRVALAPFGPELLEPDERRVGILGPIVALTAGGIALRSFRETNARLLRIRCTMQVCARVSRNSELTS
jgi:hypothetical protein